MCPCPSQHNGLPHCKGVLRCCDKCPGISITYQDTNIDATNTFSTIRLMFTAIYHVVMFMAYSHMKNKQYVICVPLNVTPGKLYTINKLVLLETLISEFHKKYYIAVI